MAEPRLLHNAPIREAVIHVGVERGHDGISDKALQAMVSALDGYGDVETVARSSEPSVTVAYRARSLTDDRNVVEVSRKGYSFTRLKPYTKWALVKAEALRLWEVYAEHRKPESLRRVSVRNLNYLQFPYPLPHEPNDYILGLPTPPEGWPKSVASFLYRHTLLDPERSIAVNVTQALLADPDDDRVGVAFDIDAFKETEDASMPLDDLSEVLDDLRDLKNRIFFGGLTERTVEMYER